MTKVLAIAIVVLLAVLGWQWGRAETIAREAANYKTQRNQLRELLAQERDERAKETLRADKIQEALNAAHAELRAAEEDARRADAAAVSLRARIRALAAASSARAHPAAAASGQAADAASDLLANVCERLDDRAGELARYADQARIAGLACQRAYDALIDDHGQR